MSFSLISRLVNAVACARRTCRVAAVVATLAGLTGFSGCGQSEPTATKPEEASAASTVEADAQAAEQVVGQFLDRIRRGGGVNDASELLSDRARAELDRIGIPIQPIGSPDATFTITRSEAVPADPSDGPAALPHRLVHCIWSEPLPAGAEPADRRVNQTDGPATQNFQVVWAVVRQPSGWKISGMVLETAPGEPPVVLDFENGELMARVLGAGQESPAPGVSGDSASPAARTATSTAGAERSAR